MTPQAAGVLICNNLGQVLLVRHNYGARRFSFPGGAVDPGEAVPDAAIREAREELGIEVELRRLLGIYKTIGGGKPDRWVHVFVASIRTGEPSIADAAEIAGLHWADPGQLPAPLTNEVQAAVQDWQAGRFGNILTVQRRT